MDGMENNSGWQITNCFYSPSSEKELKVQYMIQGILPLKQNKVNLCHEMHTLDRPLPTWKGTKTYMDGMGNNLGWQITNCLYSPGSKKELKVQ